MQTIEQATELHHSIALNAPHPGGLVQHISYSGNAGATNQEAFSMTFTSRVALGDVADHEKRHSFFQGFFCVEINITAKWGGCNHDGTPRTGTEVTVHILDRLAGGMAKRTWDTNGKWGAEKVSADSVIPLLRSLLGMESLEAIKARADEENANAEAENSAFLKSIFGE